MSSLRSLRVLHRLFTWFFTSFGRSKRSGDDEGTRRDLGSRLLSLGRELDRSGAVWDYCEPDLGLTSGPGRPERRDLSLKSLDIIGNRP